MSYIIISPVRNEEKFIKRTIIAVISQSVLPAEWIIVNDGSTDKTGKIVKSYQKDYPWIKLIDKKDRGFTQVGRGVVEAFYEGFKYMLRNWDFIVKLDCDVDLNKDYFASLLKAFEYDKYLGIAGGTSYTLAGNRLVEEKMPTFHPWAGARMYRKKCFEEIDGLLESLGWDTIDLLRAQMRGWRTVRFNNFKIIHLRLMSSRKGLWEGKLRTGRNFYITGYHPIFLIFRCIYRMFQKPYFIESFGVFCGFLGALLKREPLVVSYEEKMFLRKQQIRRLYGAKI